VKYTRTMIVLIGVVATALCFLFPLVGMSDDMWAPCPMWLFHALHYEPDANGYAIIAWLAIAVEVSFVVSLFCVLYRTTSFSGREVVRYAFFSLFLPLLGFAFTHFARLEYWIAGLYDYLAVLGITYYLQIAFLIGTVRTRRRIYGRSIRVGRLDETLRWETGKDRRMERSGKEWLRWSVRSVSTAALCVAILMIPFTVPGGIRDRIVYAPFWWPPVGAHWDEIIVVWMCLQYGVQVLVAGFSFSLLMCATSPARRRRLTTAQELTVSIRN